MSGNEKQNLTDNDSESDGEQIENVEAEMATSHNTVQMSHGSSRITNQHGQQPTTKGTEVHPNDVIIVEQLTHESLGKSASGSLEYKVIYEFPSEDEGEKASLSERKECKISYKILNDHESQKVSHLSEPCEFAFHKVSDLPEHSSIPQIPKESKDTPIKIFNTKTLIEESPDDTDIAGTSRESERKRKKGSISLLQNKKHKEAKSSSTLETGSACDSGDVQQDDNSTNSSDEFADIEDNVKDSSSSENSDSNATAETAKRMPMKNLDGGIIQRNERKDESLDQNKSMKVNYEESSSNKNNSPNDKFLDKAAKESPFPSSVKGETIPVNKLSDDMKKKFEIPLPTILEVRESESDEQIHQPKKSISNPLIMKTSVVKRKDRCNVCNARLGLCAIKCRCGGYYCAKHRYDKEHNCTFDYKSMGAAEIEKNNPKIVAERVRKL